MLAVPNAFVDKFIGQILLRGKVAWIVMRILIAVVIAQFLHQLRGSVADGQWYRLITRLAHQREGCINTQIGTIALR